MNAAWPMLGAAIAGLLAGLAFYRNLWFMVQRLGRTSHPAALVAASALARFALVLTVFYCVSRYGGWQHLLFAVGGFTLARLWMVRQHARDRRAA